MLSEVAISASSTDPTIYVWDIRSGSTLFSFKQSSSDRSCLAIVSKPRAGLQSGAILTAQTDRAVLNVYHWHRDQVQLKMPTPEKLVAVAASHKGDLVAGGTANGRVYIWQVSTGMLLKVFEAHFRQVTQLRFAGDDDQTLLTASQDATVHVWVLGHLLSADEARPAPLFSWSDHTLPVTDIAVGHGSMTTARVYTASLDSTVKVWDLATGELLTSFLFPKPVSAVAIDPAETKLFAACEHSIYPVELYRRRHDTTYGDTIEAVGGMAKVEAVGIRQTTTSDQQQRKSSAHPVFRGHSNTITCMSLSFDGSLLVSASEEGNCIVWDVASRQSLRKYESHKGPVTFVSVMLRPPELVTGSASAHDVIPMPWKKFSRTVATEDDEQHSESLQLITDTGMDMKRHQQLLEAGPLYASITSALQPVKKAQDTLRQIQTEGSSSTLQARIAELESELVRLYEHHHRVKSMHNNMYDTLVDAFMAKRRKLHSET